MDRLTILVIFILTQGLLTGVGSESILFPGDERLITVDETEVDNPGEHVDPMGTGSYLFDSKMTALTPKTLLGYNIPVKAYVSEQSRYFRAHPTFMKCAQETIMKLMKDNVTVDIVTGYKTASEVSDDTPVSNYLRSGCAMQLAVGEGGVGTVEDIAATVLQICPVIFERDHRDLGLILMPDRVHFHMSGPDSTGPLYQMDSGYSGDIFDLESWVEEQINAGLEPDANPSCNLYSPLSNGDHHPADRDQVQVVGELDVKITRDTETDFGRLVQYQGSNIVFDNTEGGSTWCGVEGHPCPRCDKIQGNSLSNRCADRVMTHRLMTLLNKLQRKVRLAMNDKLKVIEAWDEPHSAAPEGDSSNDQLHFEGRAAKLQLAIDNTENKIGILAKYAKCLGADYLEHRGTYLYVAVKRAQYDPVKVTFPSIELLSVDPPSAVDSLYSLPKVFSETDIKQHPLFDSKGRLDTLIAPGITIGQFVSPSYPYFRIHPKLVECYRDIVYQENKRRKDDDPEIAIEIIRGYLTNEQNRRKFNIIHDRRYYTHNLGVALQLRYKPDDSLPATHTPYRLLYTVIDKCAPRFDSVNKEMGVGLYSDSVFVDIRQAFHLMEESLDNLPDGVDMETFENNIKDRYVLARERRIVDPDNYESVCLFARRPEPQSCTFKHEHSETVKRRRRRRDTNPTDCVPNRYTTFCSSTVQHRDAVVAEIQSMLLRKHNSCRSRNEIADALKGCFGDCGTCMTGEVYESKQEHCNNFLHWIPWTLMNREPNTTNFFLRSNDNARIHACENGDDCIENAPLFSLIAPSVEKIYRPDPTKSVEEELYSSVNNPLPVYQLLEDIYAIQASGVVKFWIKDDMEMTALKRPLEVVMLYNRNVTMVEIYVERYKISRDAVVRIVENAAMEMILSGCPDATRETLTPYKVLEVPTEYHKRAAEPPSARKQIREYYRNYEARWADRNILF